MATLEDRIRERAYHLYLKRGKKQGDPAEDWLRAEREVRESMEHEGHEDRSAERHQDNSAADRRNQERKHARKGERAQGPEDTASLREAA